MTPQPPVPQRNVDLDRKHFDHVLAGGLPCNDTAHDHAEYAAMRCSRCGANAGRWSCVEVDCPFPFPAALTSLRASEAE